MFPSIYHRPSSTLDIQLATSRDGWNWSRPERRPIITRETEEGAYSCIYAGPNLVPLGKEWGLPCLCARGLHDWYGHPNSEPDGEYRWASWKPDRLAAIEAEHEGQITLVERECQGAGLFLNFQTDHGGWIKVALVERPQTPPAPVPELAGFGMDECDVLEGDEISAQVSWRGSGDLESLRGKQVAVRIRLAKARLFSIAM